MSVLTELARWNRKNPTKAENKLYYALHDAKIGKFQRQFVIDDKYIADLIWRRRRFIIECDGSQHYTEAGIDADEERTKYLIAQGYRILRFGNDEVLKNIDGVLWKICEELGLNSPSC
ncbi:MAG: endonuclease domain-containing protein [Alphaproteobacteria bacterium]|nr:endonuclease domain-containing protein [Alphaproteobacteria bacterium]